MHRRSRLLPLVLPLLLPLLAAAPIGAAAPPPTVHVKIIALNDFHGNVLPRRAQDRLLGGAAVLAAYFRAAEDAMRGRPAAAPEDGDLDATGTIFAIPGDFAGKSPFESAVFDDSPADAFLDHLANRHCVPGGADAGCNVVGGLGNHEFENGLAALRRRLFGAAVSPVPGGPARAIMARFAPPLPAPRIPYINGNVVDAADGTPLLPASRLLEVRGAKIGFVGAVLAETPRFLLRSRAEQIRVADPVPAINAAAKDLRARGAQAVIVLLHHGGAQSIPPERERNRPAGQFEGVVVDVITALDDAVDVVLSAHRHDYTNALVPNRSGKPILVTQAFAFGETYADVDLEIGPDGVVTKTAAIVVAWGDAGAGRRPVRALVDLQKDTTRRADALRKEVVGSSSAKAPADRDPAGLSPAGAIVAEAMRAAVGAEVGFAAPATIAGPVPQGKVTFGEVVMLAPFELRLYRAEMTGAALRAALEEQWASTPARALDAAGIAYAVDRDRPAGDRVRDVRIGGAPLDPARVYTVALNEYLARDPVLFRALYAANARPLDMTDLDAVVVAAQAGLKPVPIAVAPAGP